MTAVAHLILEAGQVAAVGQRVSLDFTRLEMDGVAAGPKKIQAVVDAGELKPAAVIAFIGIAIAVQFAEAEAHGQITHAKRVGDQRIGIHLHEDG